jgi:hypothetical protein
VVGTAAQVNLRVKIVGLVAAMVGMLVVPGQAAAQPPSAPGTLHAENGSGRISTPGLSCADGGEGASWHYDWSASLAPGGGVVAGDARVHLDLHSDIVRSTGASLEDGSTPEGRTAFLLGSHSLATIVTERGTIRLALQSGSCAVPSMSFDGATFDGDGTWSVARGTGAYRNATGNGTFEISGTAEPGADNRLDLTLTGGSLTVLQPSLQVTVVSTYWGGLGTDYLTRRPTVVYRVKNVGPGDAHGARVVGVTAPTSGVTILGPTSAALGDLRAGESRTVPVRFQLGLLSPCVLVLACSFNTTLQVDLPNALGAANPQFATVRATAPVLPPPL